MVAALLKDMPKTGLVASGKDKDGKPIFSVLVKRTYDIRPGAAATRAEKDRPLIQVDEYYDHGDPEFCTVKYEHDLVHYKVATDVVVIGKAYAPEGKPVRQLEAAVEIGQTRKVIRVIGDRKCVYRKGQLPAATDPEPFAEMEIRYERAYGGWDKKSDPALPFVYPRNPMGTGVALKNIPEVVDGLPLPNLEDPADLLTPERLILEDPSRWNRQPLPQGFGWFQKTWYPRCSFVGSVPGFVLPDEVMREETLGLVPKNQIALARQFKLPSYDIRFNNGASIGLTLPYLAGNERIKLQRLTPDGDLQFTLPNDRPQLMLNIGLGENQLEPVLHTVCIRAEDMQVDLVWRGAHEYPGVDWLPQMKQLIAEVV